MIAVNGCEYRVAVTVRSAQGATHTERTFNCSSLEQVWRTIEMWRGKPETQRIRVYAQLECFEIER